MMKRAPPVLVTDDARLYLLKVHDTYHKDRYTQKLVSDHGLLHGKRLPKAGGGSKLEITISSLDIYAKENRGKKIQKEISVDPEKEHLYAEISNIVDHKPYNLIIESGAPTAKTAPPSGTPQDALENEDEALEDDKAKNKDGAQEGETVPPTDPPRDAVDREMFDIVKEQAGELKELFNEERTDRKANSNQI